MKGNGGVLLQQTQCHRLRHEAQSAHVGTSAEMFATKKTPPTDRDDATHFKGEAYAY